MKTYNRGRFSDVVFDEGVYEAFLRLGAHEAAERYLFTRHDRLAEEQRKLAESLDKGLKGGRHGVN